MVEKKNFLIFFVIIIILPIVCCEEIEFESPEKIGLNEEFNIKIKLINFSEDNYDIKIDILEEGKRIAEILNEETWKSTYYYVNDALTNSEQKSFKLKIIKEFNMAMIEIKIRNSKDETKSFTGYEISFDNTSSIIEQTEENLSGEDEEEINEEIEENNTINEESEEKEVKEGEEQEEILKEGKLQGTINKNASPLIELQQLSLESKDIKSDENTETMKRTLSLLGIITLTLVLGLLLLLKQNKKKNELV